VTDSTPGAYAAKQATSTIPIVMAVSNNAVEAGLVDSLARPGRNITGVSIMTPDLTLKLLELWKDAFPAAAHVGILWNPDNLQHASNLKEIERLARPMKMRLQPVPARSRGELESAVAGAAGANALVVLPDTTLDSLRGPLLEIALQRRLPVLSAIEAVTRAGGLMSYGPNPAEAFRQSAGFVDKILRGAKPSELAVAQPVRFDFVINLNTARTLALPMPSTFLVRADRVIE
jgi:putative tryptophan/tyrosine transport system substrate-binding protein